MFYNYFNNIIRSAFHKDIYDSYKKKITYLSVFISFLFVILFGYSYVSYHQTHMPAEATILEHIWTDGNRLVLRYQYEVAGVSYEGHSGSYGEAEYGIKHHLKRKSSQDMQMSCPIGSKRTVYYENGKPEVSQF